MTNDQKFLHFGRMVFGMIEDALLMMQQSQYSAGFAVRKVTLPNGHGGKHEVVVIVATPETAAIMEKAMSDRMPVDNVGGSTGGVN